MKNLFLVAVLILCAGLLWPEFSALDGAALARHWHAVSAGQWLVAAALTALSFWAVSRYDVLAHRHLGHDIPTRSAARTGAAAIALVQSAGFGLVIGTLVRWRLLPDAGPGRAAQVTGFVSLLFMAALAGVTALACLLLPAPPGTVLPALAVLAGLAAAICLAALRPRQQLFGRSIDLPSLRAIANAAGWAALDVLAAAAALYVLLPAGHGPGFLAFLPVFCLALAAGLVSGTPGGMGPFEITALGLTGVALPAATDPEALVTAIIGFRLIYFAAPALLGGAVLLAARPKAVRPADMPAPQNERPHRAEAAIIHQSGGHIAQIGPARAALWPTAQALVSLFDPGRAAPPQRFFQHLKSRARATNRIACLYKAGPRTALAARRSRWCVLHIADDAVIDLASFTLHSPARTRLRRKLRAAARAGVALRPARPGDLPALAEVDALWQHGHGTARGGTMGRFCPAHLHSQQVFVAEQDGRVSAFVSFHHGAQDWALDLMRHRPGIADGTMHGLVYEGIRAAEAAGMSEVSLSAVPACPDPARPVWRWAAQQAVIRSGGPGLRQFKSAFGPRWMPLYAAAPSRLSLSLALADIARAVFHPGPLDSLGKVHAPAPHPQPEDSIPAPSAIRPLNVGHNNDEHYELASSH